MASLTLRSPSFTSYSKIDQMIRLSWRSITISYIFCAPSSDFSHSRQEKQNAVNAKCMHETAQFANLVATFHNHKKRCDLSVLIL